MDKSVILSRKYGTAIYEIAKNRHILDPVEKELSFIRDTIEENAELKEFINHPFLTKDVKKDTIQKLFADHVQPIVLQFCYVVIDRGRIDLFPEMVDVYTALSRHEMGIEEADVTSAYPLSEEQADDLKKKLQEITGYKIIMKQKVDPELIGGFTVMIGDRMIDGSVARQLRELKSKIMQRD